ncbi:hypothetical protein [Haladaptatus sp. NG-SE-30]
MDDDYRVASESVSKIPPPHLGLPSLLASVVPLTPVVPRAGTALAPRLRAPPRADRPVAERTHQSSIRNVPARPWFPWRTGRASALAEPGRSSGELM